MNIPLPFNSGGPILQTFFKFLNVSCAGSVVWAPFRRLSLSGALAFLILGIPEFLRSRPGLLVAFRTSTLDVVLATAAPSPG